MADNLKSKSITANIEKIRTAIPNNVVIVAASKTRTVDEIKQVILCGIKDIGGNYVQEAEAKYNVLKEFLEEQKQKGCDVSNVRFHLIGHLQSNKAKKAVEIFDVIQTIDGVEIAKEVNKRAAAIGEIGKIIEVLIEVNIANEANKHGCKLEDVEKIASEILKLKNLKLVGLMTMGPLFEAGSHEQLRPYFKQMKQKFDELNAKGFGFDLKYLSMGMSNSYHVAIEEGSNMVRIGSQIFGERK